MATYILGVNAFHADAAAVLLRDGDVVAAIAEERLNRVKHFAGFPELAIRRVLAIGGIGIDDVDHLAIGRDGRANLRQKAAFALRNLTRIGRLARQRLENRADVDPSWDPIVQGVQVQAAGRGHGTLDKAAVTMELGGTLVAGTTLQLSGSHGMPFLFRDEIPGGGSWTGTDLDNLLAGYRVSS